MALERGDLRHTLDSLTVEEYAYVVKRSHSDTDMEAYKEAGWSKSTYYRIDEDHRAYLNRIAMELRRNRTEEALRIIDEAAAQAAQLLVDTMTDAKSDATKLRAALEILDRGIGKPTNRHDVTSQGDNVLRFEFIDTTQDD